MLLQTDGWVVESDPSVKTEEPEEDCESTLPRGGYKKARENTHGGVFFSELLHKLERTAK